MFHSGAGDWAGGLGFHAGVGGGEGEMQMIESRSQSPLSLESEDITYLAGFGTDLAARD